MIENNRTLIRVVAGALFLATALGVGGWSLRSNEAEEVKKVCHICTQMPLPENLRLSARRLAIAENPKNARSDTSLLRTYGVTSVDELPYKAKMALPYGTKWQPGRTLRVRLMGGSAIVRAKVQKVAEQWNQFSGVKIQFVADGPAEIRVSFVADNTSWSYVGTECFAIAEDEATMNFGWLTDTTDDDEFSRVVLHEFGHALGCIHEHQSPAAGISWDKPKVYDYYRRNFNWTEKDVDQNIFLLYDKDLTQFSVFDRDSIMLYAIPAELTTDGYSVGWNRVLSRTDKHFIATTYPVGK